MEFTNALDKPSGLISISSELVRPTFGALYGFDSTAGGGGVVIDGALLTELLEPLVTELDEVLLFEPI